MKRFVFAAAFALLVIAPLVAQAPKGWMVRADRSTSASDPDAAGAIRFATMGKGFHATNPQAAVYWTPTNTATGNYTLKGTFILQSQRPSNYYGLSSVAAIRGANQNYLYFLVARTARGRETRNGDKETRTCGKRRTKP